MLLALARLGEDAYGVTVRETLPEAVRGGRAKNHVALRSPDRAALREAHGAIGRMAEGVPGL
jgi:hypothetical protein